MNAVIQRVSFPKGRRVVAVSDIHGCLDVFKALLKKVSFCPDDILVLVGDVLEKGTQSLETIRFLLGLSQTHTVYKVAGNVDILYEDIFEDFTRENGETLMSYLLRRDRAQGILHQMSREIDFPINETMDLVRWRKALLDRFPQELNFLRGWPHILESEKLIFVHAGLTAAPPGGAAGVAVPQKRRFYGPGPFLPQNGSGGPLASIHLRKGQPGESKPLCQPGAEHLLHRRRHGDKALWTAQRPYHAGRRPGADVLCL